MLEEFRILLPYFRRLPRVMSFCLVRNRAPKCPRQLLFPDWVFFSVHTNCVMLR